jgi:gliding motility-associated-like protein
VLVDSRKDEGPPSQFVFVCDRVAWVSTINGIYKVYMQYDSDKFKKIKAPSFVNFGAGNPVFNADGDAVFDRCDDTQVIPVGLLNHPNNQLKISWFKNNVEIPEWLGKQNVDLKDEGKYHAELTSLCEGITLSSINFILQQSSDPQITFNYPDNIPVCEGESYSLSTVNVSGYSYRWYRNNELIDGEASSSYFATSPGKYRVEVSNCSGFFKPSKTVTITNPMLSVPVITADNASYCSGDVANLSVTNANQNTVKWYFNGTELTDHANQNTLATNKAGNYTVKFISGSCEKNADTYSLLFNAPIDFQIIKSIEGSLCYGQSVTLTSGVEAAAYHWSTGETSRAITVSSAGHYTVQLTSINNCISSQSVDVAVLPRVLLQPINDTVICTIAGESLRINAQPGFSGYNWNGQQTSNPYFDVSLPGTYTLEVITADGCTAQTIFKVTPWCKEIIIPNTFTPNNDGINDYWKIGGIENDATVSIQIFNRYGTRLLNFKGYGFEWDGRYNGVDLPTGTYYYIIKTKNSKDLLKGPITIIR